jgi:hypothetical protein
MAEQNSEAKVISHEKRTKVDRVWGAINFFMEIGSLVPSSSSFL